MISQYVTGEDKKMYIVNSYTISVNNMLLVFNSTIVFDEINDGNFLCKND